MADIHFEIFDNADFGNKNLRFSDAPAQEQRDFLKQNGYGFTTRYGGVWYPRTKKAKDRNADFVKEFAEKFYPENKKNFQPNQIEQLAESALENGSIEIKASIDNRIAYLENLIAELKEERKHDQEKISRLEAALENQTEENIAELEMRQEQAELDDETEWEKENTLTEAEERAYLEKQSEIKIPAETIKLTSEILDSLHEAAEKESLADEPQAEKEILHDSEKSVDNNLTVSPKELAIAKSVLPTVQYVSTLKFAQGEEREFFVNKIKEIAVAVENAPKINATDGLEEHRIVLRYFHPSGTQSFITEIGKDGDAFGFQCLDDDWENAEWGYLNIDELKNIRGMEVDFHVPAGMTVEKFIQKEMSASFSRNDNFTEHEMPEEDTYINSDEFISKFGDWNKANRLEKLRKADSIEKDEKIILNGNDITSTVSSLIENEDRKGLQSLEKEIGRTILGTYQNDDTGIFVNVSNRNVTEISNHHYFFKEHIQSLAYIPEIIEKATFIAEVENEDKKKHPNIEKYLYFGTGLKLSGEDYTCKSVIGVDSSKNCYYDQSLSTIEKGRLVDYVMQNKKAGNLSPLMTQRETDLEGNEMPYVYYDKRLISVCQVPQLPYMEKLNEVWKPTKEAIELVKAGRLHIEKNGQEYVIIQANNETPVSELSSSELSRLSEEKYGFYFEYSDDENVADIYSAKDGDFVGSYGAGGFGYADDLSGNNPVAKIPEENFREVLELAEIFYHKKAEEYENLIEAENGRMMNPDEFQKWNEERKMQYSQENDERMAEKADEDFETTKRLDEIVSEIKNSDFTLESKYENSLHSVALKNKDGTEIFSARENDNIIIPVEHTIAAWANDETSEKAKSLADEFFNLVCEDRIRGGDYVNAVFKNESPVYEEDFETDLPASNISSVQQKEDAEITKEEIDREKQSNFAKIENQELNQVLSENSETSYFIKSTAEFSQFEDFEPITNLSAKEAIKKYQELENNGVSCGIGINIKDDIVFDDPKAEGLTVLVRADGKDTLNIFGEGFVKELREDNQHSFNVLSAFQNLYSAAKDAGLEIEDASYIEEKKQEFIELLENSKTQNKKDYSLEEYWKNSASGMTMQDVKDGKVHIINIDKKERENVRSNLQSQDIAAPRTKSDLRKIREQCREILKKPDSEITEADKKILAQYEGGGGLNENNRTNSEVLNAFYTPDNLIEKVWELVDAYAPDAKTVLEPSAGVGKFANNRPDNKFTMHELNETSARINKILHPEADVIQGAFQKQFLDDGERFLKIGYEQPKHDVVIGNPPYGKYNDKYKGLGEGREFDRYEEYFIARGLEALKDEKSVLAFVVPSGFLNTVSDKQKSIIASKGEILDAYRLPEGTFSTTEVGTDILIMRKKESLDDRKNISGELLSDGEWFKNHPEKILGEIKTRTNRFGKEEEYVAVHEGLSVQDELNKIDSFVDEIKKANQTEKLKDPLPEYSSDEENTEIISSPEIFTDEFAENITKFKKSLNNYFEKGIRPENDRFVIGKTPLVLQKIGSDVTEVTVPVSVIKKALETHGLSQDEIFSSLAKMYNPVLVFDSDKNATENKVNSKLILTDVFKDENPVALAVNTNSTIDINNRGLTVEVQDIRSIHDRNVVAKNGTDLIQKWTNDGLCRYVNDKKITDWSTVARVQFPIELLQSAKSNILTRTALVNSVSSEQAPLEVDEQKQEDEKSFEKLLDEYNRKYWGPVEPEDTRYDVSPVTEERLSEIKNLSKELSEYFEKGIRPENDRFVIGKTPRVLQETGSEYTDVTVTVSVIKKAVETHGLSEKEILNALTRLATPVLVFDSDKNATENKVESKLVLTDVFKDENPIALAVNVNDSVQKQENGHRKQIEVQNIRSIHDRTVVAKNGVDLIQKWANNGLCRYVDDKKITDWSTVARVYFPIEVLQSDKSNILTRTALVNSVSSEQAPLEENEKTEPEKNNASPKARKEKWNISKSKGDVMTAEEFSHLYGRDFDEREFPIWKATDWQGNIDLSKLSGDDIQYLSESGKYVEKNFGEWTHKELFTSGDIYAKIQEQRELYVKSDGNRIFADNIKLLESAMKSPLEIEKIHFGVKTALAETFTVEHIDAEGNKVNLNLQESFILWAQNAKLADRKWRGDVDFATANISREELGEELTFYDIVNYIDGKPVKAEAVRGWRTYDMSEDEKAAEKAERRKEADLKRQARSDTANRLFDRYLHEGLSESDTKRLSAEYNRRFNSYVAPDYSKLPLFVDGMSAYKGDSKFKLYDQQIKGISFLCNKGNGILAYDVGVGKTAAGIVATVNQIQTGRSKRPLIIVPNQVYSKWYTDIRQLFPNIKVNDLYNFGKDSVEKYIDSENLHRLNIPENSISLCTYEALKNITFTDESCENELYEDFASLLSADMAGSARNNAESSDKIKGIIGSASHVKDESYFFYEECGFDNLTVDEAHNFKNLWVVPRPKKKGESNEYAGIPSGKPSARALKMYGMTQLTQRHNDDRNVFMLTATPFTNSPTEVYSMLSYIGRERLKQAGITSLRAFFDEFAQTKQELGVTSTGNIDTKQVMKSWKELSALQNILTEFIDKVDGEEAGIIRPNKFTHVKPLDMSDLQKEMREIDEERMADVKKGDSAAVIVAMNNMRLSCVAPALANPDMYLGIELPPLSKLVETSPKLKFVCDAIIDMYKGNPEKGQFMYVPLGKESHGIIKDYLVAHGIPKNAVEIINGEVNNTPEKKEKITSCFNDEKNPYKIIIGGRNTAEGIDLNGNSFSMYNCSLGWNPSETIQAEGRIWRQGNLQGNVHIVYPVMNDSIDSVLYQKHDEKRSRINELWNYKGDSLNVEDINPEDLKLDLIKDPNKKAKLILQEETKEARAELSRLNLKIKSFDEIIEKRKQFELDFSDAKEIVDYQKKQIESYKESGLEVPEWIKSELKDCNKKFSKAETGLEKVNEKLSSLKITDSEKEAEYIHSLNNQKHACEEKINNIENTLPQILKKLEIERMEQKLIEYPVEKQREILEADILNNLRPMKEVEYEIKTMRHEAMLSEKLKAGEISEEEFSLYKNAGYEKYEKWLNGEIESLEENTVKNESTKENSSIKNENDIEKIIVYYDGHWADERGEKGKGWKYQEKSFDNPKDALDFYRTAKIPKDVGAENKNGFRFNFMNPEERLLELISEHDKTVSVQNESVSENTAVEKPAQTDLEKAAEKTELAKQPEQDMDSLYADSGSLFFGFNDSDILSVHSPENEYRKSEPYDDFSITERQLTESELKRDEIIFPVLNGKESGMYKSFKDFAEHGVFDVQGKSVELDDSGRISETGWNQLQAAMEIYRNKQFETFRYVLIGRENGEIKDQLAVKSYSPNRCAVSTPDLQTIKQVITRAEELDCMVAAVHNHPSGNTAESSFDAELTESLKRALTNGNGLCRFAGHIILDHDTFNLYTPQNGWKMKLNSNAYGNSEDKLLNKNFAFLKDSVDYTWQLENVAKKINDKNNWNDNFIPVVFADSLNHVSGIKLYDKSFFDNEPQKIRNELQFSGLEANSVKAFPVITKNFSETMSAVDELLFEDKLKNLVEHSAFIDAALPESTVTEKFNILPGRQYFDVHGAKLKNPDIEATWQTRINPALFSEPEQKTMRKKEVAFER